ncbi:MAG: hypothetical protein ACI92S_002119 [Planctomycetaceae bacterium]|jgi:hypothetical protein
MRYALTTACLMLFQASYVHAEDADKAVQPFFAKYCSRCHDAKKQEGKFRLDTLSRDFADMLIAQRWGEVLFRVNSGEMPPKDEPQPTQAELGDVADWISTHINEGRAARMAQRGPVSHYRLSRDEYANVVYDLLGVHFDARMPGALNEDPRWHGFNRIGSMLSLSPSHVSRYFAAAETVLDQAFPTRVPPSGKQRQAAEAPVRWLVLPGHHQGNINVKDPGLYRIRVQLSSVPSFKGRLPRLSIWNNSLKRAETGRDVSASEDKPTIIEIETFLPRGGFRLMNQAPGKLDDGPSLGGTPRTVTLLKDYRTLPTGYKLFTEDGKSIFPLLLVDWLEYEGPIQTDADRKKREGLFPLGQVSNKPSDPQQLETQLLEARECLTRLMARAWRRPPSDVEVARYTKVLEAELAAGETFRAAYLAAMTGVLTSKNFYYIVEGSPAEQADRINDWELASRLSFFLWSSMPDDELFEVARKGDLHQPDVLKAQLQRMLSSQKSERLINTFPQQWLQLHRVGMFPADSELYPDYDQWLEESMIRETTGFFGEVFSQNLSIREFLSSDWTVMNSRLAMHYGMSVTNRAGFHRVTLEPKNHRGGVLTHASVLSLTSDGTRHRPVHRGVWVSEAIFGRTPPPPPPNVEPLEPTPSDKPKATIRDQLEAHTTHATCASCHRKIDPLGFAFDNYDAIGRWRTTEQVPGGQGEDPPVNARGSFSDGRSYDGPEQFKQLLTSDLDRFAEAFVEQLATFALRRVMTIDDAPDIHAIVQASRQDDYRLRTLIERLVMSELFQNR